MSDLPRTRLHTRYTLADGTPVPSVTTVLGAVLAKPALIHWAWKCGTEGVDYKRYRDAAAEIGTLAHYLIACDLRGVTAELGEWSEDQITRAGHAVKAWQDWKRGKKLEVRAGEMQLVSEQLRFGGTCDLIAVVDGLPTLVDFKTGKGIYDEHLYQVAGGYTLLLHEYCGEPPAEVRILRIPRTKDESFEERRVEEYDAYQSLFLHALAIYRLQEELRRGA
jgi:hypothetical protein